MAIEAWEMTAIKGNEEIEIERYNEDEWRVIQLT